MLVNLVVEHVSVNHIKFFHELELLGVADYNYLLNNLLVTMKI